MNNNVPIIPAKALYFDGFHVVRDYEIGKNELILKTDVGTVVIYNAGCGVDQSKQLKSVKISGTLDDNPELESVFITHETSKCRVNLEEGNFWHEQTGNVIVNAGPLQFECLFIQSTPDYCTEMRLYAYINPKENKDNEDN